MYFIKLHPSVEKSVKLLLKVGIWHGGVEANARETALKLFYSIYFFLLPMSVLIKGITSDDRDESILLIQTAIMAVVVFVKLLHIIWKKKEILALLHWICVFPIENEKQYDSVNGKLHSYMKVMTLYFMYSIVLGVGVSILVPLVGDEKTLFVNFAFPWNYETSGIAYWLAYVFFLTEVLIAETSVLFSPLMWYLLISCDLRYKELGVELENMGAVNGKDIKRKISEKEKQKLFFEGLMEKIKSYDDINEYNRL